MKLNTIPDLVASAREGDRCAFGELVERTAGPLERTIRSWTGRPDAAPDLAQETYLRALRQLPRLRSGDRFKGWLFAIARQVTVDWRRRERVRETVALPASGLVAPVKRDGPSDALRAAVIGAVHELEPPLRTAIELRYDARLSYREIAQAEGISESTVQSRLKSARRRLARRLHEKASLATGLAGLPRLVDIAGEPGGESAWSSTLSEALGSRPVQGVTAPAVLGAAARSAGAGGSRSGIRAPVLAVAATMLVVGLSWIVAAGLTRTRATPRPRPSFASASPPPRSTPATRRPRPETALLVGPDELPAHGERRGMPPALSWADLDDLGREPATWSWADLDDTARELSAWHRWTGALTISDPLSSREAIASLEKALDFAIDWPAAAPDRAVLVRGELTVATLIDVLSVGTGWSWSVEGSPRAIVWTQKADSGPTLMETALRHHTMRSSSERRDEALQRAVIQLPAGTNLEEAVHAIGKQTRVPIALFGKHRGPLKGPVDARDLREALNQVTGPFGLSYGVFEDVIVIGASGSLPARTQPLAPTALPNWGFEFQLDVFTPASFGKAVSAAGVGLTVDRRLASVPALRVPIDGEVELPLLVDLLAVGWEADAIVVGRDLVVVQRHTLRSGSRNWMLRELTRTENSEVAAWRAEQLALYKALEAEIVLALEREGRTLSARVADARIAEEGMERLLEAFSESRYAVSKLENRLPGYLEFNPGPEIERLGASLAHLRAQAAAAGSPSAVGAICHRTGKPVEAAAEIRCMEDRLATLRHRSALREAAEPFRGYLERYDAGAPFDQVFPNGPVSFNARFKELPEATRIYPDRHR